MSGKFVRASKYRHVYGQAHKKELCYENLNVTKNAWDLNLIATNGKYLLVNWQASGGGAFAVIPLSEVGKAPDTVPLFRGHTGPVLDTVFSPFDPQQVASCSDDGRILVWQIPEDYLFHSVPEENGALDIVEPAKVLSGHSRKVGHVEYHPCAKDVLALSLMDYTVKIWNVATGKAEITLEHPDFVTSFVFSYDGSLLATACRDKKLRVWDVREGKVILEGRGHEGAKPSRVTWLGNTDRLLTTGFSRLLDRQVGLWDANNIGKGPINGFMVVDTLSGVLVPIFDASTSILYLAGKGDGNIRYYEYDKDVLHEVSQYASTDPQRGFTAAPKRTVNTKENEVMRCFKTVNDSAVEPISFTVPRRLETFQSDIYPDAPSLEPALSAEEWFSGKTCSGPLLVSMEDVHEGRASELHASPPATNVSAEKEKAAEKSEKEREKRKKEVEHVKKESSLATRAPELEQRKDVNGVLAESKLVNKMLEKVAAEPEEEDTLFEDDKEAEEEAKERAEKEARERLAREKTEKEAKEKDAKENVVRKAKMKADKEKVENAAEKPAEKTVPAEKTEKAEDSKPDAKAPTLKATVERLAGLVDGLEAQVSRLTAVSAEKDERLALLEKKLDALLK